MKKVVKFGGSSLANAEQFQKVGDIIRSDESRRYVVPSAPGKRFDEDIKVTDMLYGCYDAASKGEDITEKINAIKARYYEIIKGLGLSLSLEGSSRRSMRISVHKQESSMRHPEESSSMVRSWLHILDMILWMQLL